MSIMSIKRVIKFKIFFIIFVYRHKLLVQIEFLLSWFSIYFLLLLHSFSSHLQVHYFPLNNFFFRYFKNNNGWLFSFGSVCFMFNFDSRKSKYTQIFFDLSDKINSIFYLKSKLNQVSVIALADWQLLCQVPENAILHPNAKWCFENYSILTS